MIDREELQAQVAQIQWYHTIRLPHGVTTPGIDDTISRLERIQLPINLEGKTVLDIGAWDGSFSFEAERRGAARVLATDKFCWSGEGWGTKAGFNLAKKALQSKVEDLEIDVLDLSPEKIGTFDIVLFLGVLYHMRHPLLALEHVFSVTKTQLILDTQMDLLGYSQPAMAFYPDKELNKDPTNWWGPNVAAMIGMLKCVGFREVRIVYPPQVRLRTSLPWRAAKALIRRVTSAERISNTMERGRMVFHAFR